MAFCGKFTGASMRGWAWVSYTMKRRKSSGLVNCTRFISTPSSHTTVELSSRVPHRLKDKSPDPAGKPPVVILHGMLGSANNWRSVLSRPDFFSGPEDYVCAIDLRNHGQSQHAPTMSYEEMCDDVEEFARRMGVRSAHLIGHSMGGKVAMTLALKYPDRVASLCVVDIAPVTYSGTAMHLAIMETMMNLDFEKVTDLPNARKFLKDNIPCAMTREFIMTNLVQYKTEGGLQRMRWKVNIEALKNGVVQGDLARFPGAESSIYDGPTLFVRGGKSQYITDKHYASIAEIFPNSNVQTIEGAGHWVHHEKQDEFVRVLNGWYSTHY